MAVNTLPLFAGRFYVYVYFDPRYRKKRVPIYVGKGTAANNRADSHWKGKAHNRLLAGIFTKCRERGLEPICEISAWFEDEDAAFYHERYLISLYGRRDLKTGTLANFTDGGDGTANPSEETRIKLRKRGLGKPRDVATRQKISATKMGVKKSPESIEKMRAAKLGKPLSIEHRKKLSLIWKGRQFSAETRAKISAAKMGKKRDPETIRKMSLSRIGRKQPRSAVEKTAAANRGRKYSPESILKMSQSAKAAWQRRKDRATGIQSYADLLQAAE